MSSSAAFPLAQRRPLVLADLVPGSVVRDVALVVGGAVLTGLAAQVSFPVHGSLVPVTGQTFGALTVGAALGWRRGIASLGLYLLAGLAGMPWFAGHSSGSVHMPTLGYLIGFVAAAGIVGALAGKGADRTPLRTVALMVVGNAVVYVAGLAWLMADLHLGLSQAWDIGMRNYLLGDALKIALAAGVLPTAWRLLDRR